MSGDNKKKKQQQQQHEHEKQQENDHQQYAETNVKKSQKKQKQQEQQKPANSTSTNQGDAPVNKSKKSSKQQQQQHEAEEHHVEKQSSSSPTSVSTKATPNESERLEDHVHEMKKMVGSVLRDPEIQTITKRFAQEQHAKHQAQHALQQFLKQDITCVEDHLTRMREEIDEMQSLVQRIRETNVTLPTSSVIGRQRQSSMVVDGRKVFNPQNSLLIDLFEVEEFQTIYHIFVAVLLIFGFSVVIEEYMEKGVFLELDIMMIAFGRPMKVFQIWACMFASIFIHCGTLSLWHNGILPYSLYTMLYILVQTAFFIIPPYVVWQLQLPIASSMIVMCELTRMMMKTHSFVRETYTMSVNSLKDRKYAFSSSCPPEQNNRYLIESATQRFNAFFFFMFVPTLIYRNEYPRTGRIRWGFFTQRMLETVGCIFYTYVIFKKFSVPQFERTATEPGNWQTFIASIFTSTLPAILVYMMAFFGILHSWSNAFAELFRFADRKFYTDWWNSTSFSIYYRKWNIIVHDWLYAYVYNELLTRGYSKLFAMLSVFALSAIVHEYILTVAFHFFYPVMLCMFGGAGVMFIWLTKLFKGSKGWNIFFWFMMLIGNGGLMVLYSREWYARNTNTHGHHSNISYDSNSWVPFSWQPFLK